MTIITVHNKKQEQILRTKTDPSDLTKISEKDRRALAYEMRRIMKAHDGVGLSANQLGLSHRFFIAENNRKFYAIWNPEISKISNKSATEQEGCLSIPGVFGQVSRSIAVTLTGLDLRGKKVSHKATGFLARIFQHELDHLDGILFTDKATNIREESLPVSIQ